MKLIDATTIANLQVRVYVSQQISAGRVDPNAAFFFVLKLGDTLPRQRHPRLPGRAPTEPIPRTVAPRTCGPPVTILLPGAAFSRFSPLRRAGDTPVQPAS